MAFTFLFEASLAPARREWMVFYKCNKCQHALVVEYNKQIEHGVGTPAGCNADPLSLGFNRVNVYPGKMPPMMPAFIPPPLDRFTSRRSMHSVEITQMRPVR
jgi:hypothetical protein